MVNKFILVMHLISVGIIIGETVQFQFLEEIIPIGTLFITGFLVLHNIINRILVEHNDHIFK